MSNQVQLQSSLRSQHTSLATGLWRPAILTVAALTWLIPSATVRATCEKGCDTNDNTVLGEDALLNNTTGGANTATGASALLSNTTGSFNTSTGVRCSTTGFCARGENCHGLCSCFPEFRASDGRNRLILAA